MPKRFRSAGKKNPVKKPQKWDKVVSAAYLRLLGASQEVAAKQVGVSERAVRNWEQCSWWDAALNEARNRWLSGGDSAAMRGILKALNSDNEYAVMSRWWMERRMPERFAPPTCRIDATVGSKEDSPLIVERRDLESRLERLSVNELRQYRSLVAKMRENPDDEKAEG